MAAAVSAGSRQTAIEVFSRLTPRVALRQLLALLPVPDPLTRARAAALAGEAAARLAAADLEAGRDFIRRLCWMLNEESGGIGWGVPEAMAEALARHRGLAEEFGSVLVSYMTPGENQLEFPPLWMGAARAVERFARAWPDLAGDAADEWLRQLERPEAEVRGLARLGLCHLGLDPAALLPAPADDPQCFQVFVGWDFRTLTVGRIDVEVASSVRAGSD